MRKKVLLVQPIHQVGIDLLNREVDLICSKAANPEQLKQEVADVHGIILRLTPLTADVINAAPNLEVIGRAGVGYDTVDIQAAAAKGIPVVYSPGSNTTSVAEHTIGLIITLAKQFIPVHEALKYRNNFQTRDSIKTMELANKTVGVIGYGSIGRKVALMCQSGFGMKVLAYVRKEKRHLKEDAGVNFVNDINEVLTKADFISLHVPATKENYHMISTEQLQKMKPTAFLINTARGSIVDETALFKALNEKWIAGAAIDVFEQEPPMKDNPLYSLSNIVFTPHMAGLTDESMAVMATMVAEGVLSVLRGEQPKYIVR